MTYNIKHSDFGNLLPLIRELNIDILALQELNLDNPNLIKDLIAFGQELSMIPVFLPSYNSSIYGLAILSKYNYTSTSFVVFDRIRGTNPRGALQAIIDMPFGKLQVITTHLNTPNYYTTRTKQVNIILDEFQVREKTIVLGDFNTQNSVYDYTYHKLMSTFQDAWMVAGNHPSTGKTFPARFPMVRIDYIFLSADLGVLADGAGLIRAPSISDHLGLYAKMNGGF